MEKEITRRERYQNIVNYFIECQPQHIDKLIGEMDERRYKEIKKILNKNIASRKKILKQHIQDFPYARRPRFRYRLVDRINYLQTLTRLDVVEFLTGIQQLELVQFKRLREKKENKKKKTKSTP